MNNMTPAPIATPAAFSRLFFLLKAYVMAARLKTSNMGREYAKFPFSRNSTVVLSGGSE